MYESEPLPRGQRDLSTRFWKAYECIAKQNDQDCLDRRNDDLDVLLSFVRISFPQSVIH